MKYEGNIFRPPSEARSFILQATIGCSWNKCTYCAMYQGKEFRVRPLEDIFEDILLASAEMGPMVQKVFLADGDALIMDTELWVPILDTLKAAFPILRRVSCYANATNVIEKSPEDLSKLQEKGLTLLYIGPESGDDETLRRIAKGSGFREHAEAAHMAHEAGMKLSVIFLLGAGGTKRSEEHALESARLATAMDPEFLSALTLTVLPGTPVAKLRDRGRFELPDPFGLLRELRTLVHQAEPSSAIFRTNHASNHLPLEGILPRDRDRLLSFIDGALEGRIPLRPEWSRGL